MKFTKRSHVFLSQHSRIWLLVTIIVASVYSTLANASSAKIYSTEGYCILAHEQVDSDYLKQYESSLGFRPKSRLCNRVNSLVNEFQPSDWNYQFGQPYPGSGIYLSPEQITQIHQARDQRQRVML